MLTEHQLITGTELDHAHRAGQQPVLATHILEVRDLLGKLDPVITLARFDGHAQVAVQIQGVIPGPQIKRTIGAAARNLIIVREHHVDTKRIVAASQQRSEEHTSELQSLMRISYAVFCLKNKNNTKH